MPLRLVVFVALVALLVSAAPAPAVIPEGNLIQNPGAEDGIGASSDSEWFPPPSWQTGANLTAVQYGTSDFPDRAESDEINGQTNFFAGGPENQVGLATALQEISVAGAAPEIDAGGQRMTLSGFLGGFANQDDYMIVSLLLLDENDQGLAATQVVGPNAVDRGGQTGFIRRSQSLAVPPGTRKAQVILQAWRDSGGGSYNDGYADNVELSFGGDAGPPPEFKQTASVSPVRGVILVRERGTNQFRPLQEGESIPLGSEIDATNGEVQVTTAANAGGETQTGNFSDGAFTMRQVGGASPVTELSMKRGTPAVCRRAGRAQTAARRIRRLRGNARGRFRTRGRRSSATVRGTRWVMEERCNGTYTRVQEGSVTVRDFVKRKNIVLRRGRSYLAKPRRRRR